MASRNGSPFLRDVRHPAADLVRVVLEDLVCGISSVKIAVIGGEILDIFRQLVPYETQRVEVFAGCDEGREWAIHFKKAIVDSPDGAEVVIAWDELI